MSQFLKQARLDLFPGEDIGRALLMPSQAVIQLGALRVRERYRACFQAFPCLIQQVCFLCSRKAVELVAQIAYMSIKNVTRFRPRAREEGRPSCDGLA